MNKNYHIREMYEELYIRLAKERNVAPHKKVSVLSDYDLLRAINKQLIDLNCITLEGEEFEIELH